jgi:hypothetical protein
MTTTNINKWFNYNNCYLYFHFVSFNNCNIYFSKRKNSTVLFELNIRSSSYTILFSVNSNIIFVKSNIVDNNVDKQLLSILKSALQKAIRLKLNNLALMITKELINMNCLFELLRRLAIIAIEDVMLNRYYHVLVFLMCVASKHMIMNEACINFICSFVNHICNIKFLDTFDYVDEKKYDSINSIKECSIAAKQKTILLSVLIRISYGNMKGERILMFSYCNTWKNRFINNNTIALKLFNNNDYLKKINYNEIKKLKNTDLIIETIDFHCCPWIIKKLNVDYDEKIIRKIIWICRSSINIRIHLNIDTLINTHKKIDKYNNIYNTFKNKLDLISYGVINKLSI